MAEMLPAPAWWLLLGYALGFSTLLSLYLPRGPRE